MPARKGKFLIALIFFLFLFFVSTKEIYGICQMPFNPTEECAAGDPYTGCMGPFDSNQGWPCGSGWKEWVLWETLEWNHWCSGMWDYRVTHYCCTVDDRPPGCGGGGDRCTSVINKSWSSPAEGASLVTGQITAVSGTYELSGWNWQEWTKVKVDISGPQTVNTEVTASCISGLLGWRHSRSLCDHELVLQLDADADADADAGLSGARRQSASGREAFFSLGMASREQILI